MSFSCPAQWGKRIKGNGNFITTSRTINDYDAITLTGWFDVEIVDGNEGDITLEGEENLLEYIKTEVKDGKLHIKSKNGVSLKPSFWNNGIKITVPVESINAVTLTGSGNITGDKIIKTTNFRTTMTGSGNITLAIEATSTEANMTGSGNINLSGFSSSFNANIYGSGDIEAYKLEANNVNAVVTGSADIKVTAKETLKARVSGSGDINYQGNPKKVDTKSSGSGTISKR